jgi:hypothetical protein
MFHDLIRNVFLVGMRFTKEELDLATLEISSSGSELIPDGPSIKDDSPCARAQGHLGTWNGIKEDRN